MPTRVGSSFALSSIQPGLGVGGCGGTQVTTDPIDGEPTVVVQERLEIRLVGDVTPSEPRRDLVDQPGGARRPTVRCRRTIRIPCRGPMPSPGHSDGGHPRTRTSLRNENSSLNTGCVRVADFESADTAFCTAPFRAGGLGTTGAGTAPGHGWRRDPRSEAQTSREHLRGHRARQRPRRAPWPPTPRGRSPANAPPTRSPSSGCGDARGQNGSAAGWLRRSTSLPTPRSSGRRNGPEPEGAHPKGAGPPLRS